MIEFKNVTKIYNKGKNEVKALDNVNLTLEEKGMVIILGKSGSGKSTLLNILGGLDSITSGEILIDGKSLATLKDEEMNNYRNSFVGFVFQNFNLIDTKTVYENIELSLTLQSNKSDLFTIDDILSNIGLVGLGYRKPNELSGGQRQRVAIARAIVKKPNLILADEPSGSLDYKTGEDLFITLKKFSKERLIVVVTHDTDTAYRYGDRIIEIRDGKIKSDKRKIVAENDLETTMVTDKIMFVKAGHKLTRAEMEPIVRKDEDNFITIKEEKEHIILAYPETIDALDENYKVSDFADVDAKAKLVSSEETPMSGFKKAKPRIKENLILARSNIRKRKNRIMLIKFASIIAMVMFNVVFSVSTVNVPKVTAQNVSKFAADFAMIEPAKGGSNAISQVMSGENESVTDFFARAERVLGKNIGKASPRQFKFFAVNNGTNTNNSLDEYMHNYDPDTNVGAELTTFNKVVEVTSFQKYGLPILYGDYPKTTDEAMISDYMLDVLTSIGFISINPDGVYSEIYPVTSQDVVGKTMLSRSKNIKICGVYKTNFEIISKMVSKKENLKTYYDKTINDYYKCLYVMDGFFVDYKDTVAIKSITKTFNINMLASANISSKQYSASFVKKLTIKPYANIPYTLVAGTLPTTPLMSNYTMISKSFADDIINIASSSPDFPAGEIMTYDYLIRTWHLELHEKGTNGFKIFSSGYLNNIAIVDFEGSGANIIMSNSQFDSLTKNELGVSQAILPISSMSKSQLTTICEKLNDDNIELNTAFLSGASTKFGDVFGEITSETIPFFLILVAFIAIVLINFVTVTVKERRKELGVIRALGGGKIHTITVFIFELAYIAIIVSFFSLIISPLVISIINSSLMNIVNISLNFVSFTILNVLLTIFGYSLFLILLAIPALWKIINIQPIDVINGL